MPPTGLVLGNDPRASVREMARDAASAERAGFDMAFFSESMASNRDSVTALTAFALATERIRLGAIQVVRLRSPLMLAETAATLDELCNGRLVLALGSFTRRHAARNGLAPSNPAATLREYIHVFRRLLTGAPVVFAGEHVRMEGTALNWKPPRADIPVWVAANSAQGLATAAQIADGVLLDGATSPEYTANAVARLRAEGEAVGRDMSHFRVAQVINVSVARNRRTALAAVRNEIASRFRNPQPARAKVGIGEPHIELAELAGYVETFREEGAEGLERRFSDELVHALSASGTAAQVRDRVDRYRAAGVDLPLLRPAHPAQFEAVLATFGSTA